ncbi:MAG: peptidoglycan-binding domain-containing protein [Microcoleaceae cyanobacterium]
MRIRNVIAVSLLAFLVPGFASGAIATSSSIDFEEGIEEAIEEVETLDLNDILVPARKPTRLFQPKEPTSSLFSEPFYGGTDRPIRVRVLERGNEGEQVRGLQQRLSSSGFDPGRVDSVFGSQTEQAVREFQASKGLEVTGLVDRATWRALESSAELNSESSPEPNLELNSEARLETSPEEISESSPKSNSESTLESTLESNLQPTTSELEAIAKGARGSQVRTLQTRLEIQGYNPGRIDGVFGPLTEAAVIAYQEAKGLTANGVVNEATWATLSREWGR